MPSTILMILAAAALVAFPAGDGRPSPREPEAPSAAAGESPQETRPPEASRSQEPAGLPPPPPWVPRSQAPPTPTAPEEPPAPLHPEIVITATRLASDPFELPFNTGTVRGLEKGTPRAPRTVGDALGELAPVMVQRTSYGQGSPFLRGFTGFRTLTLVDGVRLNNAVFRDGPNQYMQLVDPLLLERAEVVFGPSSVLYGSDAIGGTVQLFSRTPPPIGEGRRSANRAIHRYSSAEKSTVTRLESGHSVGSFGVIYGASYRDYGDYSAGRHQGVQGNTGYREWSSDGKVVAALGDEAELTLAHQHHQQVDVPRTHSTIHGSSWRGTTIGSDFRRDLDEERDLAYARLRWEPAGARRGEVVLSRSFIEEEEDRIRSNSRRRRQGFEDEALGASLSYSDRTPIGRVTTGAEYTFERVSSFFREFNADGTPREVRRRGPVADRSTYQLLGVYVEDRIDAGEDLEISLGGRYNLAVVDARTVDPDPTDATPFDPIDDDFSALVGSARLLYRAREGWNLFAGASQGFRAPNLSDLTRFDAARSGEAEIPAPGLDPERFLTIEAGTKLEMERLGLQATGYFTFIDDMIVRFPTGAINSDGDAVVTKDNSGEGHVTGLELGASYELTGEVALYGAFGWIDGEVETFISPGVKSTEPLSRMPPATGVVGLRYRPQGTGLEVEADLRIADNQDRLSSRDEADTQRIPPGGTPGYAVLGARGSWRARPWLRIFAGVENITDRDYRFHGSGNNEPGTNVVAGVELEF